ncbi:hypothetical protein HML84_18940 [Alcanivorax sp. IO_7]|nr:hypothetical protein HML84_18940 [Alcanivorax sp. IO_7]
MPTGHFIWSDTDVRLAGRPGLSLRRTYNSHDPRDGMFGNGWSSSCEASLYKTVREGKDEQGAATARVLYQLLLPNGKRYTYEKREDGTVETPRLAMTRLNLKPMAPPGSSPSVAPTGCSPPAVKSSRAWIATATSSTIAMTPQID